MNDRPRRLADNELADEIEMYGELVVAASESDRELSLHEIDQALGVEREEPAAGSRARRHADA